jgi:hypothetical protein
MSFDSSRFTFDPWNSFFGVVMQQGRVQLDSDWNEWLAEFMRRVRAGTLDTLGRAVVPLTTKSAFQITPAQDASGNASIGIGQGRMYVDGLLAENRGLPAPNPVKFIPAGVVPPPVTGQIWDTALDELEGSTGVTYDQQPYYPNADVLAPFPQAGGPYLIYLDVWQREVTFLQDPDLIEKAVGVDTTGRIQTVWQVKWLDVSSVTGVTCSTPDGNLTAAWQTLLLPPGPLLTTGVVQSSPSGPCCLTPNTGFTGLENQLYRVEIHQPGDQGGTATFKWSRDNASVATVVSAITQGGTVLTVQSTGKDNVLRFSPNDWVEITDDFLELNGLPGELHQIASVDDVAQTITLSSAVSPANFPVDGTGQTDPTRHTRLIRWDQAGKVLESDGVTVWVDLNAPGSTGDIPVPPPGTTLILEDGVTVFFGLASGGRPFSTGDYWVFAARSTDGTVEFLAQAPPRGIHHHFARLAVMSLSSAKLAGTGTITLQDQSQPPISFLTFQATDTARWPANFQVATRAHFGNPANFDLEVIYSPSAGQGVTLPVVVESFNNLSLDPNAPNFAPKALAASTFVSVPGSFVPPTKTPVFSAAFSTGVPLPGSGTFQLNDTSAPPVPFLTLQTNPPANWPQNFAVSASPSATPGNFNLEVVYTAPGGASSSTVERFTNLSLATIATPVNSQFISSLATPLAPPFPALNFVGLTDCRAFWPPTSSLTPPAIHVTATSWANDSTVGLGTFLQGLQITLDGAPTAATITDSTVIVTIEVPQVSTVTALAISEIIDGTPTINPATKTISWVPPTGFTLPPAANIQQFRVRVTLKGHFIWTKSGPLLVYLDGQAFGQLNGKRPDGTFMTSLVLPSGAGVRASDFESWFFLVPSAPLQFTINPSTPPQLRGEGLTELVGDIVISGTGGTPTPPGANVPLVNITVTLNTQETSRLLGITPPALQDAVLLIDEPSAPPGTGKLNTTKTPPAPLGVGGNGIDFKDGQAVNTIVGQANPSAPNQVVFIGVPIDPPGGGTRILRITNMRANATSIGGTTGASQILALVTVSNPQALPISNIQTPVQVGFADPPTSVSVISTSATGGVFLINPATGVNPGLVQNPAVGPAVVNVILQYVGSFPGAFKPKTANQNFIPGAVYTSEESFDGAGIQVVAGAPPLNAFIGRADQGTQFVARFLNVPANVQIFVTTRDIPPGGIQNNNPDTPPARAVLVFPAGSGGKTPGGVPLGIGIPTSGQIPGLPIERVNLAAGAVAEAVWEWVGPPQPTQIQNLQFGIVLAAAQSAGPPAPVTATVRLSLGPLSTVTAASQSDPVPRFADESQALSLFTLL